MILVDTSVWVDHLRTGDTVLASWLKQGAVFTHPFVIGEIACGRLNNRKEVLGLLDQLPRVSTATDAEALHFIEAHEMMAKGIGYVDVHLLASIALSEGIRLWTRDRRLHVVAVEMGLARP